MKEKYYVIEYEQHKSFETEDEMLTYVRSLFAMGMESHNLNGKLNIGTTEFAVIKGTQVKFKVSVEIDSQ